MTINDLISLLPFYLIGAIPTGFLLAKNKGIDITQRGSGNPGATNVARVLGKKSGLLVLGLDIFKGLFAVILATMVFDPSNMVALAGFFAVLGHCFSIPPLFRGGKGVATALGVLLTLSPGCTFIGILTFATVFYSSRIVSLASLSAALAIPVFAIFLVKDQAVLWAIGAIAALVIFRHKTNLERLIRGEEPRFSAN